MKIIPFERVGDRIYVVVPIKGNKRQYDCVFLLDTGAIVSVLDITVATRLGADQMEAGDSLITVSGRAKSKIATMDSIEILGQTYKKHPIAVMDIPPQAGIHGLLGADFIGKYSKFCIGFDKKELVLTA